MKSGVGWAVRAAVSVAVCVCLMAAATGTDDRVIIGVRGDVDSLNIYTASTILSQEVADLLFLRLASERDDFAQGPPTFEPALARRWTVSSDGMTIDFELDAAARWSDGRPVTSRDVVFSHEAATSADVGWVGRDVKGSIESVTALGDHRVRYRFRRPAPYNLMDAVEGNILPAHHYAAVPFVSWPKTEFTTAPVVSGPFRLASYRPGEAIVLERNPAWTGPPAGVPRVVFRVLPDVATLLVEIESGGIDLMENVPAAQVQRLRANPRLELATVHDLSYTFVCWNLRSPLFADPRVRRALTLAIDRQAIVDGILFGNGRTLASPILSLFWAHDSSLRPHPHDPSRARSLLKAAGWSDIDGDGILDKDGRAFRFVLESNQGSQLRNDVAVMVQDHLRKVGIEAQPRIMEWRAYLQKHDAHDFDAFVGGHREATRVDPTSLLHSSGIEGGYNHAGYASRTMDQLIEQARAETSIGKARRLWSSVQALFHEDQPFTILFEMQRVNAVNRRVTGVRMSPRSAFVSLPSWRLQAGDPRPPAMD
jgi:peptide/nickel transport system substrate-binding protein